MRWQIIMALISHDVYTKIVSQLLKFFWQNNKLLTSHSPLYYYSNTMLQDTKSTIEK